MIGSIPSGLINNSRKKAESRLKLSQFFWMGAVGLACLVGVVRGAPATVCLTAFLVALIPVLGWAISEGIDQLSERARGNITIFCWFLVTIGALALGGGAVNALMVVVLLGPFWALVVGRAVVAIEVLVLGGLALGAAASAGSVGWSDTVPVSWQVLLLPLALAVLFQLGVMFWVCSIGLAQAGVPANDRYGFGPARDPDAALTGLSAPVLLIQKTMEGRVRSVYGPETLRWPDLKVGRECLWLDDIEDDGADRIVQTPDGAYYRVFDAPDTIGGHWFVFVPPESDASGAGREQPGAADEAREAAEQALIERTNFFAGLGHDLKTPLNAIIGFAELMKEQVRGPLPDAYKDYPGIIHDSGQDLMLLVEDILDLAKSEAKAQRLEPEPVDLVASAQAIGRQLADQASRAGVRLSVPEGRPVWAQADARAVRQIWQNLVSNAIKYSGEGDTVSLTALELGGAVAISVSDEGTGMDQADLDRIATPFAQGKNATGRAGTGLGLAVVHRFAQMHGGKVIIDTAPGEGTRIRVTLPKLDSETRKLTHDQAH